MIYSKISFHLIKRYNYTSFLFFRNPSLSKNLEIQQTGPFNAGDVVKVKLYLSTYYINLLYLSIIIYLSTISIYVSLYLMYLFILCISLSYVSLYLCNSISMYLSIYSSHGLSVYLCICQSMYLPIKILVNYFNLLEFPI